MFGATNTTNKCSVSLCRLLQQNLARLLFWGSQGVHRDLRAAAELYRQGAENGDVQSMHDYGIVLLKGQGVERNETSARHWLQKAADGVSRRRTASACTFNQCVLPVHVFYSVSCALQGHVNAHNALGWLALEREANYTKALEYFLFAHERGNPDASYNIGHMMHHGRLQNRTADKVRCDRKQLFLVYQH